MAAATTDLASVARDSVRGAIRLASLVLRLFLAELRENLRTLRAVALMAVVAAAFAAVSFLFLSLALTAAVAYGLGSWSWALALVGVGYAILALLLLLPGARALRRGVLSFPRTAEHLREDGRWLKNRMAA